MEAAGIYGERRRSSTTTRNTRVSNPLSIDEVMLEGDDESD
jgi:hypothetical protein